MGLDKKVVALRNNKGLTQEELAELTQVSVRTIQRIESGQTIPRNFTVKAIAKSLEVPYESLLCDAPDPKIFAEDDIAKEDKLHFLNIFCLSCFSFLLIPYVHFLIPSYLARKRSECNTKIIMFTSKMIRIQIQWVIATNLAFILVMMYNFICFYMDSKSFAINYIYPFFIMYLLNTSIIIYNLLIINSGKFKKFYFLALINL